MSGPTTVLLTTEPTLLLLSAAALRAAEAIRAAQEEADRLHDTHQQSIEANRTRQADASAQGAAQTTQRFTQALARWQRLAEVAAQAGLGQGLLAAPAVVSAVAVTAQSSQAEQVQALRTLEALADQLTALLAAQLPPGAEADALLADLATNPAQQDLAAQLAAWQASAGTGTSADASADTSAGTQAEALPATLKRLLARLSGPLPQAIQTLLLELAQARALPPQRTEALLLELRHQVQLAQQAELARAQALVLEHSLKELGYQVEEVADTLFLDGGMLHFTKPGWGQYMVRMRLDARQHTANFNVIRAVAEGQNERSALDHLAEDRWCAEFPALMAALEARGLGMSVTRRLGAGELPVQLVAREKLPQFEREEEAAAGSAHRPQAAPLPRR